MARLDFRMDAEGRIYFIECNPLPGLTPGWSDLVLIAQAAGIEYHGLIGEILSFAIRRYKERERERERARAGQQAAAEREVTQGRGEAGGARRVPGSNGVRPARTARATPRGTRHPERAGLWLAMPNARAPRCRARDLGISLGRFKPGRWNAITDVAGVRVGHSTLIRGCGAAARGQGAGAHRRHRHPAQHHQHLRGAGGRAAGSCSTGPARSRA